jgi:hypothetical protein
MQLPEKYKRNLDVSSEGQCRNAYWVGLVQKLRAPDSSGPPSATAYRPEN